MLQSKAASGKRRRCALAEVCSLRMGVSSGTRRRTVTPLWCRGGATDVQTPSPQSQFGRSAVWMYAALCRVYNLDYRKCNSASPVVHSSALHSGFREYRSYTPVVVSTIVWNLSCAIPDWSYRAVQQEAIVRLDWCFPSEVKPPSHRDLVTRGVAASRCCLFFFFFEKVPSVGTLL